MKQIDAGTPQLSATDQTLATLRQPFHDDMSKVYRVRFDSFKSRQLKSLIHEMISIDEPRLDEFVREVMELISLNWINVEYKNRQIF